MNDNNILDEENKIYSVFSTKLQEILEDKSRIRDFFITEESVGFIFKKEIQISTFNQLSLKV